MSFKVIEYSGPLFRAEKYKGVNNTTANRHYNQSVPYHFFTTVKAEVEPYRKFGTTYTKTWQPNEPLLLLDIMDISTRRLLENTINTNQLNVAFPIINNKVYRVSEEDSDHIDRAVLKAMCSLQHNGRPIDGYFMKKQEAFPPRISSFHSEIGLCRRAFGKLMLEASERKIQPNRVVRATKKRNSKNNENNRFLRPSAPKMNLFETPTKKRRMFNNNSNNNSPRTPVGKKQLSLLNFQTP
jgi:hypothetical protein